jgi:hypothetical protein
MKNEGARAATGDIIIFHDVDYYPQDVDQYHDGVSDVYLPVKYVVFTQNDLTPKSLTYVPRGYHHFKDGVDDDFFGGVVSFTKEAFFKIGGYNPTYVGWGFEDADLRERAKHGGLSITRSDRNLFYALDHVDSGPPANDPDFLRNIAKYRDWSAEAHIGINNYHVPTVRRVESHVHGVDVWLQVTDIDPVKETHIVTSDLSMFS